jgi:hypothetical protein
MERPFEYTIICHKTGRISEQTYPPLLHNLQTWEQTINPNIRELRQTKTCYIDTRYRAKLRLYNYITYTKNGLEMPRYDPYKGTEIGKNTPILNF